MKFTEKNDFLIKHTSEKYFYKDWELFKAHCLNSRLHADLKRVNSFNRKKLDGLMLYELLDKVSPDEILNNRNEKPPKIIIENIDQAKEILIKMEIDPGKVSEEFLSENIGKSAIDFESLMEVLKIHLVGENKLLKLSITPLKVDSIENKNAGLPTETGTETFQEDSGANKSEGSEVQSSNGNAENRTSKKSDSSGTNESKTKNQSGNKKKGVKKKSSPE